MTFVYSGHKCQLILIGDTAQLPPVKLSLSPALDAGKLSLGFQKEVVEVELDEVVRQAEGSGILMNATRLREHLEQDPPPQFRFSLSGYPDIIRLIDGYEIQDAINEAFDANGKEETAVIVRSNKRANLYNQNIRSRLLFLDNQLAAGDYMMVVKNNYFWLKSTSEAGFIGATSMPRPNESDEPLASDFGARLARGGGTSSFMGRVMFHQARTSDGPACVNARTS